MFGIEKSIGEIPEEFRDLSIPFSIPDINDIKRISVHNLQLALKGGVQGEAALRRFDGIKGLSLDPFLEFGDFFVKPDEKYHFQIVLIEIARSSLLSLADRCRAHNFKTEAIALENTANVVKGDLLRYIRISEKKEQSTQGEEARKSLSGEAWVMTYLHIKELLKKRSLPDEIKNDLESLLEEMNEAAPWSGSDSILSTCWSGTKFNPSDVVLKNRFAYPLLLVAVRDLVTYSLGEISEACGVEFNESGFRRSEHLDKGGAFFNSTKTTPIVDRVRDSLNKNLQVQDLRRKILTGPEPIEHIEEFKELLVELKVALKELKKSIPEKLSTHAQSVSEILLRLPCIDSSYQLKFAFIATQQTLDDFMVSGLKRLTEELEAILSSVKIPEKKREKITGIPRPIAVVPQPIQEEVPEIPRTHTHEIEDIVISHLRHPFRSSADLESNRSKTVQELADYCDVFLLSDDFVLQILRNIKIEIFDARSGEQIDTSRLDRKEKNKRLDALLSEFESRPGTQKALDAEEIIHTERIKNGQSRIRAILLKLNFSNSFVGALFETIPTLGVTLSTLEDQRIEDALNLIKHIFGSETLEKLLLKAPSLLTMVAIGILDRKALDIILKSRDEILAGKIDVDIGVQDRAISWENQHKISRSVRTDLTIPEAVVYLIKSDEEIDPKLYVRLVTLQSYSGLENSILVLSVLGLSGQQIMKILKQNPKLIYPVVDESRGFEDFVSEAYSGALRLFGDFSDDDIADFIYKCPASLDPRIEACAVELKGFLEEHGLTQPERRKALLAEKSLIIQGREDLERRLSRIVHILGKFEFKASKKEILTDSPSLIMFTNLNGNSEEELRDEKIVRIMFSAAKIFKHSPTLDEIRRASMLTPIVLEASMMREDSSSFEQFLANAISLQKKLLDIHPEFRRVRQLVEECKLRGIEDLEIKQYLVNLDLKKPSQILVPIISRNSTS